MHIDDIARLKLLAPFMHNHMITAEVSHPTFFAVKNAADTATAAIMQLSDRTGHGKTAKLWIQDALERRDFETVKIAGERNPADILSKLVP